MKLAALLSGGKDSMYSLYKMKQAGHEIACIITFISENQESYMFHTPNIHLVKEQAALLGIPILEIRTKGEKEKELADITRALKTRIHEIDGIVTGALASVYQKSRIDAICQELGLESLAPLWHQDPETTFRAMLADGFSIMITAVGAPPLDASWLGRIVTPETITELVLLHKMHGIHIMFEGGEAESLVLNCPLFSKRIEVVSSKNVWDDTTHSGRLVITQIRHVSKYHF